MKNPDKGKTLHNARTGREGVGGDQSKPGQNEEKRENGHESFPSSILPQCESFFLDAILGDDTEPKSVSGVHVSLGS